MQEYSPDIQYTGCPESHQTHRHLKTHYWALHCTPERRNPALPTSTPTQASLTRKHWQATRPSPPTGRNHHNKEKPQTARIQKGHPKHSNLNKMKRQRNIQQVKEHDKNPPKQIKEEEIGSLPEKDFNDNKNDPKSWKQNGIIDKYSGDKDWEDARSLTRTQKK